MKPESRIYVAGHRGMVGTALVNLLVASGYRHIIARTSAELDLRNQKCVDDFMKKEKPEYVFLLAANIKGIKANLGSAADLMWDNLTIEANVINSSHSVGVKRLVYLSSSVIYPRDCVQPIKEEYMSNGPMDKSVEDYGLAKLTGLKLCNAFNRQHGDCFIGLIPPNLYGPNMNVDPESAPVVMALIRRFYDAMIQNKATLSVWGSGLARREFLYSDDIARACLHFIGQDYSSQSPLSMNVGVGYDVSIAELCRLISSVVGYKGVVVWDESMPEGVPQRLLDSGRAYKYGWKPATTLEEGIRSTLEWYKSVAAD
jgi:GDP-L-fucose synthase